MVATDYSNSAEQSIGSLKIGDHVLSFDPTTGTTGIYTVTAILIHTDQQIEYLTIDGERLLTTPEHPFYTQERGFTPAGELWQGAHVRKADGSFGMVQAIKVEQHPQQMYNLTVAHAHTFFVGNQRWLVHSICSIAGGGASVENITSGARDRIQRFVDK